MELLLWLRIPTMLALWWKTLAGSRPAGAPTARPRSFIVFRLDALGDLVLTTPVFRELKRSFPNSRLTVVAQAAYRSVVVTNPHVDEIFVLQPSGPKFLGKIARNLFGALLLYWRELRFRTFDVAVSPRWDTDEHHATLLCVLTKAAQRVGYTEKTSSGKQRYNGGFDRAFDIRLAPGTLQHEILRNLALVEAVGGTVAETGPEIHVTQADRSAATALLADTPTNTLRIALGIGAQSPGRRWALERYAECVNELAKEFDVQAVITCAPSEHTQAVALAGMVGRSCIISDSAEIRQTCALLECCDIYLGNDTGAAHLAAAMGCATVVISRHPKAGDLAHPNSPARFAPFCARSRVIQPKQGLPGCQERCTQKEAHCIEQISVAEAVMAVKEVLVAAQHARVQVAR